MLFAVEVTTPRLNRSLAVEAALATLSSVLLVGCGMHCSVCVPRSALFLIG